MSPADVTIRVHTGPSRSEELWSPDVYFTGGYARAAQVADEGEWVLLEGFDGDWQVPLIVRTLVDGTKDAISPYGYSGIYAAPSLSGGQVQAAWAATIRVLRDLTVISVLLRHSPLVPQARDLPGLTSIVSGHPTIVLEPTDADSAWSGLEKRCRTKVRKALKNGYTGDVRQAGAADVAPGADFRRLYEATMTKVDAAPLYFFSDRYYRELAAGLGSNLLIAEVKDPMGAVVASSLLMRHGDRIHGHLAGSNTQDAAMGTTNLLKWIAIEFALDQGLRQFHLGGGLTPGDGLFKFKHSFGGRELEFAVSGMVIDEQTYKAHVERRAKECDTTAAALMAANYFPAYRGGTK